MTTPNPTHETIDHTKFYTCRRCGLWAFENVDTHTDDFGTAHEPVIPVYHFVVGWSQNVDGVWTATTGVDARNNAQAEALIAASKGVKTTKVIRKNRNERLGRRAT